MRVTFLSSWYVKSEDTMDNPLLEVGGLLKAKADKSKERLP